MELNFYDKLTNKICILLILIIISWLSISQVSADEDEEIIEAVRQSINIPELENSCNAGNLKTCQRLACLYDGRNRAFEFNYEKAMHYYTRSCKLGSPYSCLNLAQLQNTGTASENNSYTSSSLYKDNVQNIENRCDEGDANACLFGAYIFSAENEALGKPLFNDTKTIRSYKKACDAGSALGCWFQGIIGTSLDNIDSPVIKQIYRKGCEMDDSRGAADSCNRLASSMSNNDTKSDKYEEMSAKKFIIACENRSQYSCGMAAANIISVDRDKSEQLMKRFRILHVGCTNTDGYYD